MKETIIKLANGAFWLCIFLLWTIIVAPAPTEAETAPTHSILEGQAGYALLEFSSTDGARTAVNLDMPMNSNAPIVVCSPADEWGIEVSVGCQPLDKDTISITALLPYTITHTLRVHWIVVEPTQSESRLYYFPVVESPDE